MVVLWLGCKGFGGRRDLESLISGAKYDDILLKV